jgi:hypothetical protein
MAPAGVVAAQPDRVSHGGKLAAHLGRNTRLELHVSSGEGLLREPRRLDRSLHIHAEVNDVGDDLSVSLRLVPPSHHPEGDANVAFFHKRRNDRMHRTLAAGQEVGIVRLERKQAAAVLQREAGYAYDEAGAEPTLT